jgi:hypothetical protein
MHSCAKLQLFCRTAAAGAFAMAASGTAAAGDASLIPASEASTPFKVDLISSSRLGCGESMPLWTATTGGTQCSFDTATRGMRLTARHEAGRGWIEAYATVAHSTSGAFTPDRLLAAPQYRTGEATNFFIAGLKGAMLDDRLKLTAEIAQTDRVIDLLLNKDWALADSTSRRGTAMRGRLDATLVSRPGLKWTMAGEYRSVSDGYSVGRSLDLMQYTSLPGNRWTLSSNAQIGQLGLKAGIEQATSPFGTASVRKAGLDFQGIALDVRLRDSSAAPIQGSTLLDNRTQTRLVSMQVDTASLAAWALPGLDELPWLVPTDISVNIGSGETENRYQASTDRFRRSSLAIDGNWETPIGETGLSYWRDSRIGLTEGVYSSSSESIQIDHSIRRGNWRFGVDAALTRSRFGVGTSYDERNLSLGQSISYRAKDGPEFRLHMGQDRGSMHVSDESYVSDDSYSSITASLDLSRYLQKRFERDDLRLALDYRKTVDRSESEFSLYDELVDRWVDSQRREGFLMSFGMKL